MDARLKKQRLEAGGLRLAGGGDKPQASSLNAQSTSAVFKFDLGDVFDVDFEKEAFVEACGIIGESGFPAVEVFIESEILGREPSVG